MSNLEPYHQVTSDTSTSDQANQVSTTPGPRSDNSAWTTPHQNNQNLSDQVQPISHDTDHTLPTTDSPVRNSSGSITFSSSASDPNTATAISSTPNTGRQTSLADANPDSTHPAAQVTSPINPSTDSAPLNPHHRPSIQGSNHQGLTGDEHMETRGSISQNAPGKLGERGEAIVGAMGFGGSRVERPKDEQGVGEKIAEFLGA